MEQGRLPKFAERFAELRGNRTQGEFADFLGISRPTVGFYENGARVPDAITLRQIAERCDVSTDYLLGLSNDPKRNATAIDDLGLTAEAVNVLNSLKESATQDGEAVFCGMRHMLDLLLTHKSFKAILYGMMTIRSVAIVQRNMPAIDFSETAPDEVKHAIGVAKKVFGKDAAIVTGQQRMDLELFTTQSHFSEILKTVADSQPTITVERPNDK